MAIRRLLSTKLGQSFVRWCRKTLNEYTLPPPKPKPDKAEIAQQHPYHVLQQMRKQLEQESADTPKKRYKAVLEYDGTNYHGWQKQMNKEKYMSVQDVMEDALFRSFFTHITVRAASRTDRGVHALGQTITFDLSSTIAERFRNDPSVIQAVINNRLPSDVCIRSIEEHAAVMKMYRYQMNVNKTRIAVGGNYVWNIRAPIDVEKMKKAAPYFVGTHDFTSFTSPSAIVGKNPVRTIVRSEIFEKNGLLLYEVEGQGFLYKMVRNMVGTLVDVGRGIIPPDAIPEIIAKRNRLCAGQAAPPQGLHLVWIKY